jgi:hypothetical protein
VSRLAFDLPTNLRPERVISALIDFTERRPDLWPALRRADFRIDEIGTTWAIIREGSGAGVWARERYDWSTPGSVTWTVLDSGFSTPGDSVRADVREAPAGNGSLVHVTWERRGRTPLSRLRIALIVLSGGFAVKRSFRRGFAAIAAHDASATAPTRSTVHP